MSEPSDDQNQPHNTPLLPSKTTSINSSLQTSISSNVISTNSSKQTCTKVPLNTSNHESGYSEILDTSSSFLSSHSSSENREGQDTEQGNDQGQEINGQDLNLTTISSVSISESLEESETNIKVNVLTRSSVDKNVQTVLTSNNDQMTQTGGLVAPKSEDDVTNQVTSCTTPTTQKPITFLDQLKGFSYLAILTITAFCGSMFLMGILTPLAYFPQTVSYHRRAVDRVIGLWFLFAAAIMELILKLKFRVTGDPLVRGENCLYFMNHRTRFDWMWIWPILYHYTRLRKLKIVLKAPLKWVPGFGWACQQAMFMFLKRHWNQDKQNMKEILEYFDFVKNPVELLVFPEGTDFRPETLASSVKFALKNNLPKYNYVLHPRTTGFEFLIDEMRKKNPSQVSYVCDVTVGYPINVLQDEIELCKTGMFPREVHFHVEKFRIDELPTKYSRIDEEEKQNRKSGSNTPNSRSSSTNGSVNGAGNGNENETVGDWLNKRFQLKETRLQKFYSHPDPTKRVFSDKESTETYSPRKIGMVLCLIFWPLATFIWISLLMGNYYFRIFQMLVTAFYVIHLVVYDGFERWLCTRGTVPCKDKVE